MADRPFKFGAAISGTEQVEFARNMERLGFDSVWAGDHIQTTTAGSGEGYTYLAAMAAATSTITIGSRVIVLPLRHPMLNAKMAAQVDQLAHGRFIYGVGIGGDYAPEFENLGIPLKERGRIGNENLEVVMRLFNEERVTFEGKYYSIKDVELTPRPWQKPHPPIWMGGRAEEALERAVKYADGYFPFLTTAEGLKQRLERIRILGEQRGRDTSTMDVGLVTVTTIAADHDTAHAEVAGRSPANGTRATTDWNATIDRYQAHGNAEDIIAFCERFAEAGVRHFVFNLTSDPVRLAHDMDLLASDVLPYFRAKS